MILLIVFLNYISAETINYKNTWSFQISHHQRGIQVKIGDEYCERDNSQNYRKCFYDDAIIKVRYRKKNEVLTISNLPNNRELVVRIQTYDTNYNCKHSMNVKDMCPSSSRISIYNLLYNQPCASTYDKYCYFDHNIDQDLYLNTYHEPIILNIICEYGGISFRTSLLADSECEEFTCSVGGSPANELTNTCDQNTESQDYYIIYIDLSEPFKLYCNSILQFINFMEPTSGPAPLISQGADNWYTITTTVSSRFVCNKGLSFNHEYWVLGANHLPEGSQLRHNRMYGCSNTNGVCKTNLFESKFIN